jgi:hypothetical protein
VLTEAAHVGQRVDHLSFRQLGRPVITTGIERRESPV